MVLFLTSDNNLQVASSYFKARVLPHDASRKRLRCCAPPRGRQRGPGGRQRSMIVGLIALHHRTIAAIGGGSSMLIPIWQRAHAVALPTRQDSSPI